jgi:hypothetical protein
VAVVLRVADAVLGLRLGLVELPVGVVGPYADGSIWVGNGTVTCVVGQVEL